MSLATTTIDLLMATAIPTQLEGVLSDLAEQEAAVASQLAEIQAKQEAIKEVMALFGDSASAPTKAASVRKKTTKAPAKAKSSAKAKSASKTKATKAKTTKSTAKSKTVKTPKSTQKGTRKKKDGRAASWQKYALPGVNKKPMPESVQLILETQPDKDFKIAEVMSALFKEDMPKSQYLKARNRISNILSGGVRNGEWFKGERGAYRLTAAK